MIIKNEIEILKRELYNVLEKDGISKKAVEVSVKLDRLINKYYDNDKRK